MCARACFRAGDPASVAGASRDLAVERDGEFQMYERQAGAHEVQIRFVHLRCFVRHQAGVDLNARSAQMREALAGNFRVEILDRRYDALDAGADQRIGARRGAAVMCVWFEQTYAVAPRAFSPAWSRASV